MANKISCEKMKQQCENAKRLGFRPDRLMLLDERLTEWSKTEETPSIAVKIMRHGETAFEGAYGTLGPGKAPDSLTMDSIFPVCSLTKPIVAVLLLMMQEEGLVDLNHPVQYYLPEFAGGVPNKEVRIWHLLAHTSGLLDNDVYQFQHEYIEKTLGLPLPKRDDPEQKWDTLCAKVRNKLGLPVMEPGVLMRNNTFDAINFKTTPSLKPMTIMQYSNIGYQMAAEVIRRVSGKKLSDYTAEKLFVPLKMTDSHFLFPREKLYRYVTRADNYVGGRWMSEGILDSDSGYNGIKSTAPDLTRFAQMILNGGTLDGNRFLSPASIQEMTTNHIADLPMNEYDGQIFDSSWGLGWNVRSMKKDDAGILRSPRSYEHAGFGCCRLLCDPDADITAAFFTVSITDTYIHANHFFNILFGAIDDVYDTP